MTALDCPDADHPGERAAPPERGPLPSRRPGAPVKAMPPAGGDRSDGLVNARPDPDAKLGGEGVAIVTGASSGIGAGIARRMLPIRPPRPA
ncbi:hypothetical protein [Prosthecomicrobium sp. N25]|uniref:hypothetical protein n=1 Tax=Prosthecomicrobium sp. N25 TaxID=3129254 RepID=UPI0030785301